MSRAVRQAYRWKLVRAQVLRGAVFCELCGGELDFDAPARSRWSPSVDHIVALARGGDPYALSNLRVAHYGCNSSRKTGERPRRRRIAARRPRKAVVRAAWW